jgi:hypothetical protein
MMRATAYENANLLLYDVISVQDVWCSPLPWFQEKQNSLDDVFFNILVPGCLSSHKTNIDI